MSCDGTHRRGGKKERKMRAHLASTPECRRVLAKIYTCVPLDEAEYEMMRRIYGSDELQEMLNDAGDMAEQNLMIADIAT